MTIHELVKQARGIEANDWCLAVLWGIARLARHGIFGEIGFQYGSSALALLIAAREVKGHVYSIDIDSCEEGRERVTREGYDDLHTFLQGDSAVANFPEELDLLFIDGSHEYEDVVLDYERHSPRVRPGGVILFHDPMSWPGVGRFLREMQIPYFELGAGLGMKVV